MTSATSTPTVSYPITVDSVEASAPALSFKEYEVPGLGELEGYGDRLATIKYPSAAADKPTTLRLLDFTKGTSKQVVAGAVNFKDGFNIVGVSGEDRWLAWEEMKGNEDVAPLEVQWKLYVAKIDADALTCGKRCLWRNPRYRCTLGRLFRVAGDSLFWMTNSMPNRRQEGAVSGAIVKVRDLNTGTDRTVCETDRHFEAMSVGDDNVIVTERGKDDERSVLTVIDPDSGDEVWSLDLMNTAQISHFPQVHEGAVAWTVFAPGGLGYPDLFYRGTDGITHRVRDKTSDPMQVGRYVFYDGLRVVPNGTGMTKSLCVIGGYDTVTNETFTLLEGDADAGGWWMMPMGRGYSPDTFVITNDSGPVTTGAAAAPMRIRRYTVPTK